MVQQEEEVLVEVSAGHFTASFTLFEKVRFVETLGNFRPARLGHVRGSGATAFLPSTHARLIGRARCRQETHKEHSYSKTSRPIRISYTA